MKSAPKARNQARRLHWRASRRAGLAPLELVLSLPILMFVMALIVNLGVVASWKTRAASTARHAAWRERFPRRGASDPQPQGWPTPGQLSTSQGNPVSTSDAYASYISVRGPTIPGPVIPLPVNTDVLDIRIGIRQGNSNRTITMPLLPKLRQASFQLQHPLLNTQWQFSDSVMALGSNTSSRASRLYQLWVVENQHPDQQQQFTAAVQAIYNDPNRSKLDPYDRESLLNNRDFFPAIHLRYSQNESAACDRELGDSNGYSTCLCDMDFNHVSQNIMTPFLDQILGPRRGGRGGVPERLAQAYLNYYQQQLNQINSQIMSLQGNPGNASQLQGLQSQQSQYQTYVDQLQRFIGTLN